MRRLSDLIAGDAALSGDGSVMIAGLTADSRAVKPGFLFAALPGSRADGRAFVAQAVAAGAAAVLLPQGPLPEDLPQGVAVVTAGEPRHAFALMAARFHGRQPATVCAVTGTNGKTSTAVFTQQLWAALGHRGAALGTLGIVGGGLDRAGSLTTPDPVALHAMLAEAAAAGCTHLCMEASSHGLDQHRLDGVDVAAAAFTNLTRDHLDYHGTVEAYLAAKTRLFTDVLRPGGTAVLNADVPEFALLEAAAMSAGRKVVSYGERGDALRLLKRMPTATGQHLDLRVAGTGYSVDLPLAGGFQAMNALAALGLVIAGGADPARAVAALEALSGVPGRLEAVGATAEGASVFVDYAHTPDALETVLAALRPHAAGRLVVVFGCGGDRDRGKRPQMGAIAARLADAVTVTDDNPRSEDPAAIRAEVLAGCPDAAEIGDRRAAIRSAVAGLKAGDVLVIAGKGHESGQTVGTTVLPFDDRVEARAALATLNEGGPR
ncbi:UDP-N-acetylmuramoyl-L-alanyl-D-glutamate--2,6-diaminopimelate ligase [Novispirillum sp. DQ9]|uniref:UDP-N-acetylmuramoyl-L-alanyl-D-glutamate--2, 6-diaminopimelate ligase n=1 Tax=Novispirillum sp. DQ9 TaxID=3398612 RepID=UPI003C7BB9EC